jgi:transposase-like protein
MIRYRGTKPIGGNDMAVIEVRCPYCGSKAVIKAGRSKTGEQRYRCNNESCNRKIFQLEYKNKGCIYDIERTIIKM